MRILFTGGSSFTGYWFIRELASAGHDVTATFQKPQGTYEGIRGRRVDMLDGCCRRVFGCRFGDDTFLGLIRDGGGCDLLCHHAADVTDYKSPRFDVVRAVANNTHQLTEVLEALVDKGCRRVVLTGSVFEPGEGAGSDGLRAFSPYGLSKGLTADIVRYYCETMGLPFGKFVIANPFGPWEEPRFTAYLVRSWLRGETPTVGTPAYVRDNIHVSLLAKAYCRFVESPAVDGKANPSGYVETQGSFARRFAVEMGPRLRMECPLVLADQRDFAEPRVRINIQPAAQEFSDWNESTSWDELADHYQQALS